MFARELDIQLYSSMLPPAASTAAFAPLVKFNPFVLTAVVISPDKMTLTFCVNAGTKFSAFNASISITSALANNNSGSRNSAVKRGLCW